MLLVHLPTCSKTELSMSVEDLSFISLQYTQKLYLPLLLVHTEERDATVSSSPTIRLIVNPSEIWSTKTHSSPNIYQL
jgi:hypothetical protein